MYEITRTFQAMNTSVSAIIVADSPRQSDAEAARIAMEERMKEKEKKPKMSIYMER